MRQAASLWTIALVVTALPLFLHRCSGAKQPSTPPARQSRQRSTTPTSAGKRSRPADTNKQQRRPAPTRSSARYDDDDDDDEDDSFGGKWSDSEGSGTGDSDDVWGDSCEDDLVQESGDSMPAALNDDDDDIDDQGDGFGDDWNEPQGARSGRSAQGAAGAPSVRAQKKARGNTRRPGQSPPFTSSGDYESLFGDSYNDDHDGGYDRHLHEPKFQRPRVISNADDTWIAERNDGEDSWDELARESRSNRGAKRPRPSAWTGDSPPPRPSRRKQDRRVGGGGRGTVTRYQRRAPARPAFGMQMPAFNTAAIASALKRRMETAVEAMGHAGSVAATTTKRLKREVKLAVSGSWESALLKVTWPDDTIPDEVLVRSLVEAVKEFKRDRDVTKNSAEHRVLLRKLWTKMSEPDWRTVTKAVYLFHSILQKLPVEDHAVLKIFLGKMSRERDKRTGRRYFDLEVLCDVSQEGQTFRPFVDRYGTYVFTRAEGFNARFQELDNMRPELGWEHVVTTLAKAMKAIDLGIACQPEPEEETEVTVLCLRSTAQDVRQLWRRYHSALAWILEEAESGGLFDGLDDDVVEECVNKFKHFYTSSYFDVSAFLADAEELLGIYGLHVPDLSIPPEHTFDTTSGSGEPTSSKDEREGYGDAEDEVELDEDTYGDHDGDDDVTHGESKSQAPQSLTNNTATRTLPAANNNDKPSSATKPSRATLGASGDTGTKTRPTPSELTRSPVSTTATMSTIGTASSTSIKASGYPTKPTRVPPKSAGKRHDRRVEGVEGSRSAEMIAGRRATAAAAPKVGQSGSGEGPAVGARISGTEQGTSERAATSAGAYSTEQTSVKVGVVAGGGIKAGGMSVKVGRGRDGKEQEEDQEETENEDSGVEDDGSEEDSSEEEDSCEEGEIDDVDDLTYFDDATQAEGTEGDWDRC